jgi:hypothetical protein
MSLTLKSLFSRKPVLQEIPLEELSAEELRERYELDYSLSLGSRPLTKDELLRAHRLANAHREKE